MRRGGLRFNTLRRGGRCLPTGLRTQNSAANHFCRAARPAAGSGARGGGAGGSCWGCGGCSDPGAGMQVEGWGYMSHSIPGHPAASWDITQHPAASQSIPGYSAASQSIPGLPTASSCIMQYSRVSRSIPKDPTASLGILQLPRASHGALEHPNSIPGASRSILGASRSIRGSPPARDHPQKAPRAHKKTSLQFCQGKPLGFTSDLHHPWSGGFSSPNFWAPASCDLTVPYP